MGDKTLKLPAIIQNTVPEINFKFIVNHHYFETNTAYSVYVGREALSDQHLLMNADVVYPKELLSKLYHSSFENVLAVDIRSCGREEVKVIDGGQNKISAIGKDLIEDQCLGEFIGVAKFSSEFMIISQKLIPTRLITNFFFKK